MSTDRVAALIATPGSGGFFTGGVGEDRIREVEQLLDVRLPESYKWFLRQYGYAGVRGVEILGVGKAEKPPAVVETTEDYRKVGLPQPYVVVCDCDEWLYCLQTDKMAGGECPVAIWGLDGTIAPETYADFLSFLVAEFEERLQSPRWS